MGLVELPERRSAQVALVLAAVAVLAAGIRFRLAGTFVHPLWLDEAYSAYAAHGGWRFLWTVVPRYETHPPFYYSLLRLWTLPFGDSLVALRALGLCASLLTLPVMVMAGRELDRIIRPQGRGLAVPAAVLLLAALAPYPIAMAHEVRPYPVLILVYAAACLAVLRIARTTGTGGLVPVRPLAAFLVCEALVLWLHNMGPLYALALGLALLVVVLRRRLGRRDWLLLVGGHVLVGLVYLPGFLILLDQAPTWVQSTWVKFTTFGLRWRLAAIYAVPTHTGGIAAALLLPLALLRLAPTDPGRRVAAALLLLAAVPVTLSILLSTYVAPVFIERTMTACAVPALLLLGAALGGRGWLRWPALAALAVLVYQMASYDRVRFPGRPPQDWYPAVRWLNARFRPGDVVLAYPNEGALPFAYAMRDLHVALPTRPIPSAVPSFDAGGWHPTGSRGVVSLPRPRLRAIAEEPEVRRVPTVWLLRLGANAYDVGDVFLDELSRGRRADFHFQRGPIDIVGLRRAELPPPR